jgi:hypothetical protein
VAFSSSLEGLSGSECPAGSAGLSGYCLWAFVEALFTDRAAGLQSAGENLQLCIFCCLLCALTLL